MRLHSCCWLWLPSSEGSSGTGGFTLRVVYPHPWQVSVIVGRKLWFQCRLLPRASWVSSHDNQVPYSEWSRESKTDPWHLLRLSLKNHIIISIRSISVLRELTASSGSRKKGHWNLTNIRAPGELLSLEGEEYENMVQSLWISSLNCFNLIFSIGNIIT